MDADRLNQKLEAAGCIMTSGGSIAVDVRQLVRAYIAALQKIEQLEDAAGEMPGQGPACPIPAEAMA